MSAVSRCVSLTALVALFGIAAASEVKGPVHISSAGVTHFNGDTARFHAAMDADARGAMRQARQEAREAMSRAGQEAREHIADVLVRADEAMQDVRVRLAEARRDIAERHRDLDERRRALEGADQDRWDNAIEIRDGRVVRCADPAKFPGTGCTPFTPEEKARIEAEVQAATAQARAAMAQAELQLREAERALNAETSP